MTRKKSALNLKRRKYTTRKVRPTGYLWTDSFAEAVGSTVPFKVQRLKVNTLSPVKSPVSLKYGKRILSPSPAKSPLFTALRIVQTPSKFPFRKRAKRCLETNLQSTKTVDTNPTECDENDIVLDHLALQSETTQEIDNNYEGYENESELFSMQTETCEQSIEGDSVLKEMQILLPHVVKNLTEAGFELNILDFFRQVGDKTYPFTNMALLLWAETVKWFSQDNSSKMRYSDDTNMFWKLGYRMFGGRFIRFMSGYKNEDQVVTGEADKGIYPPDDSKINFAIPDVNVLRSFRPYEGVSNETSTSRQPGVLHDSIDLLARANEDQSFCVTFDGKKLKMGTFILGATAKDADIGSNDLIEYSLSLSGAQPFRIDRKTGVITATESLSAGSTHSFQIEAVDKAPTKMGFRYQLLLLISLFPSIYGAESPFSDTVVQDSVNGAAAFADEGGQSEVPTVTQTLTIVPTTVTPSQSIVPSTSTQTIVPTTSTQSIVPTTGTLSILPTTSTLSIVPTTSTQSILPTTGTPSLTALPTTVSMQSTATPTSTLAFASTVTLTPSQPIVIPSSAVQQCNQLAPPNNGDVANTCDAVGCTAVFSCDPGFRLSGGEETLTCLHGAGWNGAAPRCLRRSCGVPFVLNALLYEGGILYDDEGPIQCDQFHTIDGPTSIRCRANGAWSTLPTCIYATCGNPRAPPAHGNVVSTCATVGCEATYTCDEGYSPVPSPSVARCQEDLGWEFTVICVKDEAFETRTVTSTTNYQGEYDDEYKAALEDHLNQVFTEEVGEDFEGVVVTNMDFQTGEFTYEVVTNANPAALRKLAVAFAAMTEGTGIGILGQNVDFGINKINGAEVVLNDTQSNTNKSACEIYEAFLPNGCPENTACTVVDKEATCQPIETETDTVSDNLPLIIGLSVGLPAIALAALIAVCCCYCCGVCDRIPDDDSEDDYRPPVAPPFLPRFMPLKLNTKGRMPSNYYTQDVPDTSGSDTSSSSGRKPDGHDTFHSWDNLLYRSNIW